MSDIKYSYYQTSAGYKVVGKSDNDVLLAGGGSIATSHFALSTNSVTLNTDQNITSQKTFYNTQIFKNIGNEYHTSAMEIRGNGLNIPPSIGFHHYGVYGGVLKLSYGIFDFRDAIDSSFFPIRTSACVVYGGLPTQFLKADGSLDSNTYTSKNESDARYMYELQFVSSLDIVEKSGVYRQENPAGAYSYSPTLNLASSDGRGQIIINRNMGGQAMFRSASTGSGNTGWSAWYTFSTEYWTNSNFIPKSHPVYAVTAGQIKKWEAALPKEYLIDPSTLSMTIDDSANIITIIGGNNNVQSVEVETLYPLQTYRIINLSNDYEMTLYLPGLPNMQVGVKSKIELYVSNAGEVILIDSSSCGIWD